MNEPTDHIGLCVCTFKRPHLLEPLLVHLENQKCADEFSYSIHIVDNDRMKTAEAAVSNFAQKSAKLITYQVEPIQNIALARNRAVRSSQGNFIAFLDDDEFPGEEWLLGLYRTCLKYRADGALGPVKPFFGPGAPAWLKKSGLCERPSFKTGTELNYDQTRTGNVLLKRSILQGIPLPFPPELGKTGGEDIEFFKQMIARGRRFVWCEEAPVFEHVLPDRHRRRYYIDKSLRIGGLTGEMFRHEGAEKWKVLLRSGGSVVFYLMELIIDCFRRPRGYMKNVVKIVYHLGRISGCLGFVPVRYRPEGSFPPVRKA